jgi:non-specific serine/threonine protein kinase/serine/threonine-protein kinase
MDESHREPGAPEADAGRAAPGGQGPSAEAERWQRIREIFFEVVEHQRTAREEVLREVAARDPAAAAEALSLLRRYDEAPTSFLERAPLRLEEAPAEVPDLTGRTVGGYRLTAALGRGGMGMVYEAIREEDGKRAAVKLLRWHGDPVEVADQVRAERRILAALEHDNIARLIDGGATEEGWPYFTLEFVDGQPIHAYCEERGLDLAARLALFAIVCAAVEYAHQRLVIHCDIKPANIMVTREGVPKLLDFGIARLVQSGDPLKGGPDAPQSALSFALTPEYASPEQVRGRPVTTATDVYALGLLLFELLTGRRAQILEELSPRELVRVVCESAPPRPSLVAPESRRRGLAGDLDAIVAKALSKEPAARYGSAREMAEEVRRHLRAQPVEARAGGAVYRASRFVRRHRAVFAASLLVLASLVTGTVAALREARLAQRRFEDVRKLAGSFLFEVHDAIRELPGATPARRLLVTKAVEYLDRLAREARGDLGLTRELALAYQRVGEVQGYTANANLGDTPGAKASFEKAVALAERLVDAAPADAPGRLTLATALEHLGTALNAAGDGAAARRALDRAQGIAESLHRELPQDGDVARQLHIVLLRQGRLSQQQGQPDAALASFEAAARVDESYLAAAPGDRRARRDLSVAQSFAAAIVGARDPARGLELYLAMLPPAIELAASDPTNAELQRDVLVGYEDVAQMQTELGQLAEALENQNRALAIAEELVRADPANQQALQDLSVRHAQIGDVQLAMGRLPPALESYRRSLDLDARVAARDPTNAKAAEYLGWSHLNVAQALKALGQPREALDHYREAIAVATPFSERDPANALLKLVLADSWAGRGETGIDLAPGGACPEESRKALARALELWDSVGLEPGPDKERRDAVAGRLAGCSASPSP